MVSLVKRLVSNDGATVKHVWRLEDGNTIESVFLRHENYNYDSLCVSSQVGCNLKCAFCATGLSGLVRNLNANEILAQIQNTFEDVGAPERDFEVSYMGMGEPLLNLDFVLKSLKCLKSKYPGTRFSISTVGIVPKIHEMAERETDVYLHISLHAPNDYLRQTIMPIARRYPIMDILEAARHYTLVSGKVLRVNYLLLSGVNDSDVHADELVGLIKDLPVCLKISKFNSVPQIGFTPASNERHRKFTARCSRSGLCVYQFSSMGSDIGAGCGQLRSQISLHNHATTPVYQ